MEIGVPFINNLANLQRANLHYPVSQPPPEYNLSCCWFKMKAALGLFAVLVAFVSASKNVVIDISHHNGDVDLEKAKGDGITTIVHKCTQGTKFVDSKYRQNKESAEKLGLTWAAYHFADGSDGKSQTRHFLAHAGSVKVHAVVLTRNPSGTTVNKTEAEYIVKSIKEETGSWPIVYGSPVFLDSLGSQVLSECPLWVASYRSSGPRMPKLWSSWIMWQYTNGDVGPEPHTVKGVGKVLRSYLNVESLVEKSR